MIPLNSSNIIYQIVNNSVDLENFISETSGILFGVQQESIPGPLLYSSYSTSMLHRWR